MCIIVVDLCVLLSYVYLLYYVCIVFLFYFLFLILNAGLLATGQNSEGPATGHLDTGFFGFPSLKSKCWDGSQDSKLPLHASHVALLT